MGLLAGNVYANPSSSDPGAVGFGYQWAQTDTGNWYYRNTSNTAWVFAFNSNQVNMGLLPLSGGTMTGAILGASGLMPTSGGDFSVAPTINGNTIATTAYVDTQIATVQASITTQIATAIAQIPGLSVGSKIAIGAGRAAMTMSGGGGPTPTGTYTLPLPVYGDGTTAVQSEVNGRYYAWLANWSWGDEVVSSEVSAYDIKEQTANSRTFIATYTNNSGVAVSPTLYIGYIIIGIKST